MPNPPCNAVEMLQPRLPSRRWVSFDDLEPLLHPPRHRPQIPVNLAGILPQDQTHDALPGHVDVLEPAEDVDLGIGQHDAGAARVLDGELGLAVFAGDAADGAAHVLALQGLDVFDLEGLDVEVVEAEEGDGVVDVEAQREGFDEVFPLLQSRGAGGLRGGAELHAAGFDVHADLEVEVLDEGGLCRLC